MPSQTFLPHPSRSPTKKMLSPLRIDFRIIVLSVILFPNILVMNHFAKRPLNGPPPEPLSPHLIATRDRYLADLPKCAAEGRATSFLMIFMGHSGSTALMTSLQQHSETHIDGFEPVDHGTFRSGSRVNDSKKAALYTHQFFLNSTTANETAGFKLRPFHVISNPVSFLHVIRLFRTRIIWSFRTNVMKQAIGDYRIHMLGDKTGYEGFKLLQNGSIDHKSSKSQRRGDTIRITDFNKLHSLLLSRVKGEEEVQQALQKVSLDDCVLPVSYESYLKHPQLTLERVQKFLGLNTDEMHASLRAKANQDSLCELVENWDEVCQMFFGCPQWRWMMDDFENGCSCSSLLSKNFGINRTYCAS